MSKAFTKDDADVDVVAPTSRGEERRPITREGHRALQVELAALSDEKIALAHDSALQAKGRLRDISARLQLVASILAQVTPADAPADPARVFFGAYVTVRDGDGRTKTWHLVGPDEVDATRGNISVQSPIAKALLGRTAGDEVDVELPRGDDVLTILSIRYEH